jgi:hypothetical protein
MFAVSCGGCPAGTSPKTPAAAAPEGGTDGGEELEYITEDEYETLPIGQRFYLLDGQRDFGNRYPFAVMIGAPLGPVRTIMCSGTLLSPNLVLTAGHCVCGEHEPIAPGSQAHTVIDGARCATTATIETVTYTSTHPSSSMLRDEHFRSYGGKVKPHPDLEIQFDERATPISSKADLAVIVLDEPVEGTLPTVYLPEAEPLLNETFTIVGYGFDGRSDLILGLRRFGRKKITRLPTPQSEGLLFEQEGATFTSGSGEPCVRQEKKGVSLLGITTLTSPEGSAFTSGYAYKNWLLSELHQAATALSTPP